MNPLLKFIFWNFNIIGLNPFNRNGLAYFLCFLSYVTAVILTMAGIFEMTMNWRGIDTLDEFYMFPIVLLLPAKLSGIALRHKLIIQMVDKIEMFWPHDKFGNNDVKKSKKLLNLILIVGASLFVTLLIIHIGVPMITHQKELVYPGNFLCNLTTTSCFDTVYYWQLTIVCIHIIPLVLGSESFFICCVSEAYFSIEMVKIGLRRFKSSDDDAKKKIGDIVHQHAIILSFIDDLCKFYNETMLLQFWSSLGTLIFSLYMLGAAGFPSSNVALKHGTFLYFISAQLLVYCFGGTLVLEQTLTVADEAYFTDWWAITSVRNDLSLIITRSQKASKLLIGNMATLNLPQFVTVLRNALSVYGLLKTMKQNE